MKEGWFLTELIYRIHSQNEIDVYQFDKQMKLIKASSIREAYQLSLVVASREIDLRNSNNAFPQWEFAGIGIFQTIDEPKEVPNNSILHYTVADANAAKEHMIFLRERMAELQMEIALSA